MVPFDPVEEFRPTFKRAAELLEKKGWIQFRAHDEHGYCLVGALDEADRRDWDWSPNAHWGKMILFVRDFLREPPTQWNDAQGRTKEEVLHLLRILS